MRSFAVTLLASFILPTSGDTRGGGGGGGFPCWFHSSLSSSSVFLFLLKEKGPLHTHTHTDRPTNQPTYAFRHRLFPLLGLRRIPLVFSFFFF